MNELMQAEIIESSGALQAQTAAEVDLQIQTAKTYPRDLQRFYLTALNIVSSNEMTAQQMFFSLPRGKGKQIEGPSVRLAEVVFSCYQNLRVQTRIIAIGDNFVTAQGVCHDLENNIALSHEVKRRITGRDGKRFNDDMIGMTCNAACAIAYREAIFKVVPRHNVSSLFEEAKQVAIGNVKTLSSKRTAMIIFFQKMGISVEQICRAVGVRSEEEIKLPELGTLKGLATALKDGDASIDDVFPQAPVEKPAESATPARPVGAKLTAESLFSSQEAKEEPKTEDPRKRGRPKGSTNKKKPRKKAPAATGEPAVEDLPVPAGADKPTEEDAIENELQMAELSDNLMATVRDETGLTEPNLSNCDNLAISENTAIICDLPNHMEIVTFIADIRKDTNFNDDEKLALASVASDKIRKLSPVS